MGAIDIGQGEEEGQPSNQQESQKRADVVIEVRESETAFRFSDIERRNMSTFVRRIFSMAAMILLSYVIWDLDAVGYQEMHFVYIAWGVFLSLTIIDWLKYPILPVDAWQTTPRIRFCGDGKRVMADNIKDDYEGFRFVQLAVHHHVTIVRMGEDIPMGGVPVRTYYFYNPDFVGMLDMKLIGETRQYILEKAWTEEDTEALKTLYKGCESHGQDILSDHFRWKESRYA